MSYLRTLILGLLLSLNVYAEIGKTSFRFEWSTPEYRVNGMPLSTSEIVYYILEWKLLDPCDESLKIAGMLNEDGTSMSWCEYYLINNIPSIIDIDGKIYNALAEGEALVYDTFKEFYNVDPGLYYVQLYAVDNYGNKSAPATMMIDESRFDSSIEQPIFCAAPL
jgi:hypothetical protein